MTYERYCQACDTLNTFSDDTKFAPCRRCRAMNFDAKPRPHSKGVAAFDITEKDIEILRIQGIKPEWMYP